MKYVILSADWHRPVYFCVHKESGFTVSTDSKKAQIFHSMEEAQEACAKFTADSGMKCEIKKL